VFAWKASKFITHWKRLNETSVNSIALLESRLHLLGEKAGPVLFQLPPQFKKNRSRIEGFLKLLPPRRRYAFEFRHPSWYEDEILDLLRNNDIALCISDHHDAPSPWLATASFGEDTVRAAVIGATTPQRRSRAGSGGCLPCGGQGERPMSTLTTIKKARLRRMRRNFRPCSKI
jgi:uncharacterized protein YecE (DUF72 family)